MTVPVWLLGRWQTVRQPPANMGPRWKEFDRYRGGRLHVEPESLCIDDFRRHSGVDDARWMPIEVTLNGPRLAILRSLGAGGGALEVLARGADWMRARLETAGGSAHELQLLRTEPGAADLIDELAKGVAHLAGVRHSPELVLDTVRRVQDTTAKVLRARCDDAGAVAEALVALAALLTDARRVRVTSAEGALEHVIHDGPIRHAASRAIATIGRHGPDLDAVLQALDVVASPRDPGASELVALLLPDEAARRRAAEVAETRAMADVVALLRELR